MENFTYLVTGEVDPGYNLAFEEYVLTHRRRGNYLILWQNGPSVIIGRNQNAEREIHRPFVDAHGIRVVRRNTGGGAVYHDLGNLNYSFITDASADCSAAVFTQPVVAALRALGLDAESSGRNDILVSGKKVSGTAQQVSGGRLLHHGTLLFDSDTAMLSGALNPDDTKFLSKGIRSVSSRVGNIRSALAADMTLAQFWAHLEQSLACGTPQQLTEEEKAGIIALKKGKYDTFLWNFGRSPAFALTRQHRFPEGLLEIRLTAQQGILRELGIYGDFLAVRELTPLVSALTGIEFSPKAVEAVLRDHPPEAYLGGITAEQFLQTMFE